MASHAPDRLRIALALLRLQKLRKESLARGDPSHSPRMGCAPATPAFRSRYAIVYVITQDLEHGSE